MSTNSPKPLTRKGKWTDEELIRSASRYSDIKTFRTEQKSHYVALMRRGLSDHMSHMVKLPGAMVIWTKEAVQVEALKYKTRKEFQKAEESAYLAAARRGFLDEVCSHMVQGWRERTEEEIRVEAAKYTSIKDFSTNAQWAAAAARKRGIYTELTKNMSRTKRTFDPVKPAHFYTCDIQTNSGRYVGFGVSNNVWLRFKYHQQAAENRGAKLTLLNTVSLPGWAALNLEKAIKKSLSIKSSGVPGFIREAIEYDEAAAKKMGDVAAELANMLRSVN